jgi:hypothetical protein
MLLLVFNIFILSSACFAKSISIDCAKPYASGSLTIQVNGVPANPVYVHDTINFNGVTLSFFSQKTLIPEPCLLNKGLIFTNISGIAKMGFKYSQSTNWKKTAESTIEYYSSGDTIWDAAIAFPDYLAHLDSLHNGDSTKLPGKWLYYTDGDLTFGSWASRLENYNNIIYIQTNQNKLKLQVSHLFISPGLGIRTRMDSLRIYWAVDSLGNGKFSALTNVKRKKTSGSNKSQLSFMRISDNYLKNNNSCNQISLFDMQGKCINKTPQTTGVFIYKIIENKTSLMRKVILR